VVLAWHPDHIGGPARSTNVKPIFNVAPSAAILPFFMRGGAPESAWFIVGEFGFHARNTANSGSK